MKLPSPTNPERAPVWENYIIAQAVQASLGLIPRNAVAAGVEVRGSDVRLHFQLTAESDQDRADMEEIATDLSVLVGDDVSVEWESSVRDSPDLRDPRVAQWIYLERSMLDD